MNTTEARTPALSLFVISFVTLFGELLFIRYLPSNIYLLSYYKNSVLIAIFLGFGTGFMLMRDNRRYIDYLPVATLVIVAAVLSFNTYLRIDLDYGALDESIWPEFWANTRARSVPMLAVLVVTYITMALYFIPLGQETARSMARFSPLKAYSINIAGSLAGIIAFTLAGWMWTKPLLWFIVLLVPLVAWSYAASTRVRVVINAAAVVITLFIVYSASAGPEAWSPYSKIRVYPYSGPRGADLGFISTTNGNPQVGSMNMDAVYTGPEKRLNEESRLIYELPYTFMNPRKVMVAGAGAGNETAIALRKGVETVAAVELDPVFVELGRVRAPQRPFADSRVDVHVDDARAFFQKTRDKYDLVVIGFLDSQYRLSHLSNIRTENFVYTYESLSRTRDIISENGILQLNYNAPRMDMRAKLYFMLADIYGDDLAVLVPEEPVSGNISYLAGPGLKAMTSVPNGLKQVTFGVESVGGEIDGTAGASTIRNLWPTDDWPFLYLEEKKIPSEYWSMLVVLPLLSIVLIRTASRGMAGFSPRFFLLGLGFMLLETKSITSLALLFGSTGMVVSVVLAAILAAILLANLLIGFLGLRSTRVPYVLTMASVLVLYFIPLEPMLTLSAGAKVAASMAIVAAPIFFSALVFGISFSGTRRFNVDFGSNIFGAVVGGLSEYASMALGLKSLYLLSLAAYLGAFIISEMRRKGSG